MNWTIKGNAERRANEILENEKNVKEAIDCGAVVFGYDAMTENRLDNEAYNGLVEFFAIYPSIEVLCIEVLDGSVRIYG